VPEGGCGSAAASRCGPSAVVVPAAIPVHLPSPELSHSVNRGPVGRFPSFLPPAPASPVAAAAPYPAAKTNCPRCGRHAWPVFISGPALLELFPVAAEVAARRQQHGLPPFASKPRRTALSWSNQRVSSTGLPGRDGVPVSAPPGPGSALAGVSCWRRIPGWPQPWWRGHHPGPRLVHPVPHSSVGSPDFDRPLS